MTKPNPWARPVFRGPAHGGPLTGSDIEHDQDRKDVFVCNQLVGFYLYLDGCWLWQPSDAS